MSSGNEILDTYIYENNALLEQLETIILDAEEIGTLSQDNINEIFRIMHTIKGSSAMMEFDALAVLDKTVSALLPHIGCDSCKIEFSGVCAVCEGADRK